MKIASFDVDAQKGFTPLCPNELPVPEGDAIVPALNQLAARAQLRIGSKDAHSPQAAWVVPEHGQMLQPLPLANADLTWVSHCVPGTPGFELLDGLPAPLDYDYFVWKGVEPDLHPYGACYHDLAEKRSTGVIEFLRQNGVDLVLVGGLALDYCVKTTALQLRRAGFEVIVHLPACRAIASETAETACLAMREQGITLAASLEQLDSVLAKENLR
ncbi:MULTISPECIES: nicotinamidase [Pseudomonadaceae]|jgi:nicotinamidase/pyrazinamidase|uniref:nicotinamidase n=1 Tax=Ectopseudomonas alcaliphila TaxID=101564 RepID=A0A1G6V1T7_9GAMM|nr:MULTISPECIES: nicotinamidase [Pseudomonas]MDP9939606.1 nicotinamidase/pyrazinamidase [Pseudomonas sp. 3400]MDR7012827.1 nicotinamidase/pyrazinamidase [Pseudomonas alcaliphila]MDX5991678.1 nicotinamidase [Pseudomonas alcaliphila]SDD47463.1 nicotinamidase/pyrazinamidase [Pseudomonas alcaliphila]